MESPEVKSNHKVLIAIQARSNSTRFPQKIYNLIGKKMVLQHVIDAAKSSKIYVERAQFRAIIKVEVAVLHPEGDSLATIFRASGATLISGDEQDVLSRFIKAQQVTNADYVVRLTSDCPLILDHVISKHINVAVLNNLDYVSNVDESVRLIFDGMDCEIMSKKALQWLSENAHEPDEKEHVTIALRRKRPKELNFGFVSSKFDSSRMKLSLDTPEDLDAIRNYYHEREHKMNLALKNYGKRKVFEI